MLSGFPRSAPFNKKTFELCGESGQRRPHGPQHQPDTGVKPIQGIGHRDRPALSDHMRHNAQHLLRVKRTLDLLLVIAHHIIALRLYPHDPMKDEDAAFPAVKGDIPRRSFLFPLGSTIT